jgi:inhibitor of cysteine peptidase
MKKLSFVLLVGMIFTSILSACSSGSQTVKLSETDNGKSIELKVGDKVELTLASNPTTGYDWEWTSKDGSVLTQLGDPAFVQEGEEGLVGAGGKTTYTFEATATGEMKLKLVYHRAWETDVPPVQEFEVTIVVK